MPMEMTAFPVISTLTAGLILILQMALMINVGRLREKTGTLFGDGDEPMQQAIRVHANLAENAGIVVVTLALAELAGGATWAIATLCGLFLVARLAHAVGLSRSVGSSSLRLVGATGTLVVGLLGGGYAAWLGLAALL